MVSNTSQSPFVISITEKGEPVVCVLSEGMRVRLRPLLRDEQKVWLDCQLTLSRIGKVDTFTFAPNATVQIPECETTRVDTSMELPLGKTLAIGGLTTEYGQDEVQPLLVLVELTKAPRKDRPASNVDAKPELITRTYAVADLVVPLKQELVVSRDPAAAPARPDFKPLVDLITSTIAPASWEVVGGRGAIQPLETNLSVVIRQTEEVHEEITDLLEQLRRLQDIQVVLETEVFDLPSEMLRKAEGEHGFKLGTGRAELSAQKARQLRESVRASKDAIYSGLPKVILFNGQLARIPFPFEPGREAAEGVCLRLQGVATNDRRAVRVTFQVIGKDDVDAFSSIVGDGKTVLFDATGRLPWPAGQKPMTTLEQIPKVSLMFRSKPAADGNRKRLIVVTPRIIIQEEEEQRLGIGPAEHEGPRTEGRLILGGVEPRIIIQEEEEERLGIPEP